MDGRGVVLLTVDPGAEQAVSAALAGDRGFSLSSTCRTIGELTGRIEMLRPPAVLVDVDQDSERMLQELEPVVSRNPGTRFVLIADSPSQNLLLEAMEIGARNVVAKGAIPATLSSVLHRVLPNGTGRRGGRGCVISVMSASGGCGATLLATNLANELRLESKSPVLLVDLDLFCGAVSSYLGLDPHYGLENVLADPERIDGDLIRSAAALYDESLYVLQSPSAAHSIRMGPVKYENLPRLMDAAKSAFKFTVLDAPRLPIQITADIAAASTFTLVPFQLTVLGIRAAKNLMTAMTQSGIPSDQIVPVATRFRKRRTMIGLEEACKALDRPSVPRLSNDFKSAVESINFGKPLSVAAARSGLRHDVRDLAVEIQTAHRQGRALMAKA